MAGENEPKCDTKGTCVADDISCNFETENIGEESATCGWTPFDNAYNLTQGGQNQWRIVPAKTIDNYVVYPDRSNSKTFSVPCRCFSQAHPLEWQLVDA